MQQNKTKDEKDEKISWLKPNDTKTLKDKNVDGGKATLDFTLISMIVSDHVIAVIFIFMWLLS